MKAGRIAWIFIVAAAMVLPAAAQSSGPDTSGQTGASAGAGTSTQSSGGAQSTGKKAKKSGGASASEMSTGGSRGVTHADRMFLEQAAAGGLMEVQLGQLAAQKASDPQVKQFGQRMVDDHTKANDQLKTVAQQERH